MSQEKRHKKYTKNRIILIIFALMAIYFLFSILNGIIGFGEKTVLPEMGTLYAKTPGQGIVIKDERVYYSDGNGNMTKQIVEGKKVPVGEQIATVNFNNDNSAIREKIVEVDEKIDRLISTGDKSLISYNQNNNLDENIDNTMADLQSNINGGNYERVKNNVNLLKNIREDSSGDDTLVSQSLSSLQEEKEKLVNQINKKTQNYYANESGIVSYTIDGYETILLPKDFENYTYDVLTLDKRVEESNDGNNAQVEVSSGQVVFKIINSFEWYLAIKIDNYEDISQYEVGDDLVIKLEELEDLEDETQLNGKVQTINITGEKAVVVLRLNTHMFELYNTRLSNLNIVHSKKEGLKIPTDVIIEKEGKPGVLINGISRVVVFRQISILGEEGEFTYIDRGNSNGYIESEDGESYKTVSLYDEIFSNPNNVTEGEILK